MSKKLYDHFRYTNYADINNKIKKDQKKKTTSKVHTKQNMDVEV